MCRRSPAHSSAQRLIQIVEDFNKEGMTGAKDPGIDPLTWELYQELLKEGRLDRARCSRCGRAPGGSDDAGRCCARVNANLRPPASLGDGVLLVRRRQDVHGRQRRRATAWMHDDWNKNSTEKDTGNTGYPAMPPEVYRQIVTALHNAGVHVSTHAIGDRAIDWVVDTYAAALAAKPTRGLRHGIIHANTPTDHAIDVMARCERNTTPAIRNRQAPFTWWIGDNYAAQPRTRARPPPEPVRDLRA